MMSIFLTEFVTDLKMVSRESVRKVFLPDKEDYLKYLREHQWPNEVTCPNCRSADTINKGTTRKDVQCYRCRHCDGIFNDLTEAIFSGHQLSLPEVFYIIREIEESTTERTVQELDRTHKTVLDFGSS